MSLTSKYKLAEQCQRIINGGTPTADAEVSIQEIAVFVGQAFAQVASLRFFEGKAEGESYVNGSFIFPYPNVKVQKDADRDVFYSDMPASAIVLPHETGLYEISLMKGSNAPFVRVPAYFNWLYRDLPSSTLENRIGYFLEQSRVIYINMNESDGIEKVLMKLVAPLGDLDDDDEIAMPDDVQLEIVEGAVKLYGLQQQQPKDMVADNVK